MPGPRGRRFPRLLSIGLAMDPAGNLFVADTLNSRIRKIAAGTGTITTVAGTGDVAFSGDNGPGSAAALNFPIAVATDAIGNVFITDTFNHRIRKINSGNGIIRTVVGNGVSGSGGDTGAATDAALGIPIALLLDRSGNLVISDSYIIPRIRAVRGPVN